MHSKEWFLAQIDELTNKELFDELTEQEKIMLKGCREALEMIDLKEQGVLKVNDMEKRRARKKVDKRWKGAEDWVCEKLGLKRWGHIRRGVACSDGVNDILSVDVTTTKQKLAFINRELDDAKAHNTGGRTPMVVIFQVGKPRMDGIVAFRFKDFNDLYGN